MKISTKGRYAIRMMLDIAENSSAGNVSLKDVAMRQSISLKYLEQIINMLCKAGYVRSQRGSQGGYKLQMPPEAITIGNILRVTEGDIAPVACLAGDENDCERASSCVTLDLWKGLNKVINEYLDGITLSDLLEKQHGDALDMCMYI